MTQHHLNIVLAIGLVPVQSLSKCHVKLTEMALAYHTLAALYGARGGNGVIMVTTKSAKKGQEARITFDAKWGANMKGGQNYARITNPAAYYETYFQKLKNYAMAGTTLGAANGLGMDEASAWKWANENLIEGAEFGLRYNVYTQPEGQYLIGMNGKLNPNAKLGRIVVGADGKEYYITPDNWEDEIYHTSLRQVSSRRNFTQKE